MDTETFLAYFETFVEAPNGIERFRTLIHELAFNGSLVQAKPDGLVHEMSDAWSEKSIAEVIEFARPGFACSKSNQVTDGHVHLRTHNVSTEGRLNFDLIVRINPKLVDPERASLRAGDVIFNNTNSQELVGKTCLVDRDYDYAFSNHLTHIRLMPGYLPGFFVRQMNMLWRRGDFARLCNRWIGQAGINTKSLKAIRLRFPSLVEQQRIVAKLDELLGLCDTLAAKQVARREARSMLVEATLDRLVSSRSASESPMHARRLRDNFDCLFDTPTTIPQLRQTILQLAVQGQLVAQDSAEEPANARLLQTLGIYPLESKLKCSAPTSYANEAPGRKRTSISPSPAACRNSPYPVPSNWVWAAWGDVLAPETGAFKRGPFGSSLRKADFVASGYKVYEQYCPINDDCSYARYYITESKYKAMEAFAVRAGDFLISCSGVTLGRITQVPTDFEAGIINQALLRVRINDELLDSGYFKMLFRTPYFQKTIFDNSTGSAIPNVKGVKDLKAIPVPLPPLAEQKRIVSKVRELLALCDALEAKLSQAEAASAELSCSVIHTLFTVAGPATAQDTTALIAI